MSNRKQFEEQVRAKLAELEKEIDGLAAKVREAEKELVPEENEHFKSLHAMQKKARDKFNELVEAGDETFDSMQKNLEEYWSSLGREVKAFELKLKDKDD